MSLSVLILIDVVAILILTFGLYWPRHRRKSMVVAYLTANIGVAAVASVLSSSSINAGLGLGLFGILSIIRLRSAEMEQSEVAYYFAALALGLLGGFSVDPAWLTAALMGAIVAAVFIGDHPRLFADYRQQVVTLDRAYTDEQQLIGRLERLLGADVHHVAVRKVDLVTDITVVDTRDRLRPGGPAEQINPDVDEPIGDRSVEVNR